MVSELDYRVGFFVEDWALSQLHARAFAYPSEPPHVQQEPWAARLNRYSLSWVGAFHDAQLIGFVHACWDGGRHAFLLDTVVDPHHRRRGAGTGLVLKLIDQVRHAGCEWLHVDYVASLDAFYRSCGFRPTNAGLLHLR